MPIDHSQHYRRTPQPTFPNPSGTRQLALRAYQVYSEGCCCPDNEADEKGNNDRNSRHQRDEEADGTAREDANEDFANDICEKLGGGS